MSGVIVTMQPSEPNYRMATTLGGVQFILDVRWNTREAAWYFDVLQEDETPIRRGLKVTLGLPIGAHVTDPEWPRGYFYAIDTSQKGVSPGLDDLGDRVQLYWFSADEIGDAPDSDNTYTLYPYIDPEMEM